MSDKMIITKEVEVEENGKKSNLKIEIPIEQHKVSRGKGMGNIYLGPNFELLTLDWFMKLYGPDNVFKKIILPKFRNFCSTITREAKDDASPLDPKDPKKKKRLYEQMDEQKFNEYFEKMLLQLSARGESVVALKLRRMELLTRLGDLDDTSSDYDKIALALMQELRGIQQALADKKTDDEKADEDKEEEEPVTA